MQTPNTQEVSYKLCIKTCTLRAFVFQKVLRLRHSMSFESNSGILRYCAAVYFGFAVLKCTKDSHENTPYL